MKKKMLIGGLIIAVLGIMVTVNVLKSSGEGGGFGRFSSGPTQEVEVKTIEKDDISSSILLTGLVEEISSKTLQAESMIKVNTVLVEVGDMVTEGQALLMIDMESLEEALNEKELDYHIQNLNLERIRAISPNTSVKNVEVSLEMAKLGLSSAERDYADAVADLEKNKKLFEGGVIPKSEYESYEKALKSSESNVSAAKLDLARSQEDLSTARKNSSDTKQSSNIDIEIQLMNIKQLDNSINNLKKEIRTLEALMLSPMSGVVTDIAIEDGDMPTAMSPILTIVDMSALEVKVAVKEYDLPDLALGQHVMITGDALSKEAIVSGEVSFIAPIAIETVANGRTTRAVEVTIKVTEGSDYLKPGFTTECDIMTSELKDVLIVSYDMLRKNDDGEDYVLVLEEDMTVREQVVELGTSSDFDAEVLSGLKSGDQVVLNPAFTLVDGSKVRLLEATEEEGE